MNNYIDVILAILVFVAIVVHVMRTKEMRYRSIELIWQCQQIPAREQTILMQLAMENLRRAIGGVPWDNEETLAHGRELMKVQHDLIH